MTIEIWSINHKDRNISLCLCGMMPLRNHFCKKSVPSGQHPPVNSLHVRPWALFAEISGAESQSNSFSGAEKYLYARLRCMHFGCGAPRCRLRYKLVTQQPVLAKLVNMYGVIIQYMTND